MPLEMVIKVDKQGRIVLPKEIRDKYHFDPNSELSVIEQEDGVILKSAKAKVPLAQILGSLRFDPINALALDVANFDEDEE